MTSGGQRHEGRSSSRSVDHEVGVAEAPARKLLGRLGWRQVEAAALAEERDGVRNSLLVARLRAALLRLNEWMDEATAERVIGRLRRSEVFGVVENRRVHEWLIYGMPFDTDGRSGPRTRNVRFFDFEHPEGGRNEFLVATQFRVRRGRDTIVPDLVLFVNGIPLVVMEAKSPTIGSGWRTEAVEQLRRYQGIGPDYRDRGAPDLFRTNLLTVAHCGAQAVYGAVGAGEDAYAEWKSVEPLTDDEVRQKYGVEPTGQAQLIVGLLRPAMVLEVLRDFVLYEPQKGRLVKKLPRYQQYRAVQKALRRIRSGGQPEKRGGVIWHTQGSGKSLTAFWLATKLRRDPAFGNSTILVVTDRRQLNRQIADTFDRCGFPAPETAESGRHLANLLTTGRGRTVMTTIQKFEEALPEGERATATLDPSDEVIVMVDEAHRTQYGTLGALLSQALPRAALIGFTGTPIDQGFRRSTMNRFGSLIDRYSIEQAVEDGATVEIRYEARLPELEVEGPNTLDRLFDAMFGQQPDEVREQIRRRYANKETVSEADRRIEMIALDIADHFKTRIRPNGFKAQVVAPSRRAALRYSEYLNRFEIAAYPIITVERSDGPEFDAAREREVDEERIIAAFKDPEGEPQILVVVDKLLTGFDAPVEQVLYLDQPLRDHGLLQAIARVNRRFRHHRNGVLTEKTYGLVVDYHGVSRNLEQALSSFSSSEVKGALLETEADPAAVIEAAAVRAESHFEGRDLDDAADAALAFAGDSAGSYREEAFERFEADYRAFARLMDRFLPDPRALAYRDRLARLTAIRAFVRAQYLRRDDSVDWADIGAKVRKLLDGRISPEVRELMAPVSILAGDFDEKIAALPHDEARASLLEHALRAEIRERRRENRAYYEKLSERLKRIIRELREQVIDAAEAVRRLGALRGEMRGEADAARARGLSPLSFAIFRLLEQQAPAAEPVLRARKVAEFAAPDADEARSRAARDLEAVVARYRKFVDWEANEEVLRRMRREIKRRLRGEGCPEMHLGRLALQIVENARRRSTE